MDEEDREGLSMLGSIIESWDSARFAPGKREDKLFYIGNALERLMNSDKSDEDPYIDELNMDMQQIQEFSGTDSEFESLCEERATYWKEVRQAFIREIQ